MKTCCQRRFASNKRVDRASTGAVDFMGKFLSVKTTYIDFNCKISHMGNYNCSRERDCCKYQVSL